MTTAGSTTTGLRRWMRRATLCACLLLPPAAQAQMDELLDDEAYAESVALMSDCSATWMFFAAVQRRAGNEETAARMKQLQDSAALAAQFLLQTEDAARTGTPKPVGTFEHLVVARYRDVLAELSALLREQQLDVLEQRMQRCADALDAQASILNMLRDAARGD